MESEKKKRAIEFAALSLSFRTDVLQTTVIMLHAISEYCNILLQSGKDSSKVLLNEYKKYTKNLNTFSLECSHCHTKGNCVKNGHYERSHLLHPGDLEQGTRIDIQRIKCRHCSRTHALLPEQIVPYLQFAAPFIYSVLIRYYARAETVAHICESTQITPPVLYRWKARFEKQKDQYLGVVESEKHSAGQIMDWLCRLTDYAGGFADSYLRMTEKIPMQSHKNPSNTCRPVFQHIIHPRTST